ncbi:MAG: hypothetical protein QOI24_3016 [Acidobacteriota bacterium]|jgi:hypothetical protein|nr:hypothetical protein [Acidobacteriota bacterium]MEA2571015.1 hypothetical protein [Acidobacteriota bacterium]
MSSFNPTQILKTLNRHDVHYVVIGGIAASIHGSSADTYDLDVCYDRSKENLKRLAAALGEMKARLRGFPAELPFVLDEQTLRNGDTFTFITAFGDFDCLAIPQGSGGYRELLEHSKIADFHGDVIRVSSIDDLIRMKRAAGRPKDVVAVDLLEAIRQLES